MRGRGGGREEQNDPEAEERLISLQGDGERKERKGEEERWPECSFYYEMPELGAAPPPTAPRPHGDGSPQEVPPTFTPRRTERPRSFDYVENVWILALSSHFTDCSRTSRHVRTSASTVSPHLRKAEVRRGRSKWKRDRERERARGK